MDHARHVDTQDQSTLRRMTLVRGEHRWSFLWDDASEPDLLERLRDLAQEPLAAIDSVDFALLRAQIVRKSAHPLKPGLFHAD